MFKIKTFLKKILKIEELSSQISWLKKENEKIKSYFNLTDSLTIETDSIFLRKLKKSLDKTISIWGDENRVHLGSNVSMVDTLFNTSSGDIYIGDNTFTGHRVCIITGGHDISYTGKDRQLAIGKNQDIIIGKGVWIGSGCIILGPCTIGDNAVIAAGSVVLPKTTVEEGALYAGTPAIRKKEIKLINTKI